MYMFNISALMGGGMSSVMGLFHSIERDPTAYGSLVTGADGVPYLDANVEQKLAAVKTACCDIVRCLNKNFCGRRLQQQSWIWPASAARHVQHRTL